VIDHEAVLVDPKLFSSWVRRSVVLLKRRFGRQTSSRWRFSQNNDWIVQVIPQQAMEVIPVLSARKMVIRRPAAEVGVVLFTTTSGLYGGVLWSGEFQGFIIHELVPTNSQQAASAQAQAHSLALLATCCRFPRDLSPVLVASNHRQSR
jgi:hypothetical protein